MVCNHQNLGLMAFGPTIASHLTEQQEEDLLAVLRENRKAVGWALADIKGISPSIVQHRIHLIDQSQNETHSVDSTPLCKRLSV